MNTRRPPTIIPAHPGFDAADCLHDSDRIVQIEWEPVIAWRVDQGQRPDNSPEILIT